MIFCPKYKAYLPIIVMNMLILIRLQSVLFISYKIKNRKAIGEITLRQEAWYNLVYAPIRAAAAVLTSASSHSVKGNTLSLTLLRCPAPIERITTGLAAASSAG
jgi:hypothetical protein